MPNPDIPQRPQADIDLGRFNRNPAGIGFWALVREDFGTHESDIWSGGFWAIFVHRFGNWRMGVRPRWLRFPFSLLYRLLFHVVQMLHGILLDYTVQLGRRVHIWHQDGIILSALAIGDDVHIRQGVTMGVSRRNAPRWLRPRIGDRVDIGAGAVIVGGIVIGDDCVIGANVVLATDLPANSIATVPAPLIRKL